MSVRPLALTSKPSPARISTASGRPQAAAQVAQGQRVRMPGLADRAQLPFAEHPGQHRERGELPVPQVAGVRIGTRVQQQPGGGQDWVTVM
jgi:hypothetical protein